MTNSGTKSRAKILERAPADQLPKFRLTARDSQVFHELFRYRLLLSEQVYRLVFQPDNSDKPYGNRKRANYRLRLMWDYGYVYRFEAPVEQSYDGGKPPLVYTLDKKGIRYLADETNRSFEEIERKSNPQIHSSSSPFLRHLLKTNDVRITVARAAKVRGYEIKDEVDDQDFHADYDKVSLAYKDSNGEAKEKAVAVIPDFYCWLDTGKNWHIVWEIDLSTVVGRYVEEGRKDWARRVKAYIAWYGGGQGLYRQRFPEAGKSFRVVTICQTGTRLGNLKEISEKSAGKYKDKFWYTTFDLLEAAGCCLTEPIWKVAGRGDALFPLVW